MPAGQGLHRRYRATRHRAVARDAPRVAADQDKLLTEMHGIFRRAMKMYGLACNPAAEVGICACPSAATSRSSPPRRVIALVRAAADELDAANYLTAAFTGLRRWELIALRWRDVDFANSVIRVRASYATGALTTPKSGKVRAVPLAPQVADDDPVFAGEQGGYLDGSALRRRYAESLTRGGLRRLRFHDLRHTFATRMIAKTDIVRVQEWMGHADIKTTHKYLHFAPRGDDARPVAGAFAVEAPVSGVLAGVTQPVVGFHGNH
jgi:integrase